MLVKILRAFPYAADGIRIRDLAAGAVEDISDDLIEGLVKEGYVAKPTGVIVVDGPVSTADRETMETAHAASLKAADVTAAKPEPAQAQPEAAEPYPHLSAAQVEALDRVDDGVLKPGGSPKGGGRKRRG